MKIRTLRTGVNWNLNDHTNFGYTFQINGAYHQRRQGEYSGPGTGIEGNHLPNTPKYQFNINFSTRPMR